jgi:carboxymethylenebutenolidase
VICADLYCRLGHGTPDDVAAKARSLGDVRDDSVVADCEAALRWLKDAFEPGQQAVRVKVRWSR